MDMQGYIGKYGRETAEKMLDWFRDGYGYGVAFGLLTRGVERDFLQSIPFGFRHGFNGFKWLCCEGDILDGRNAYTIAKNYTLPDTPPKPEYFVGELKPLGLYTTPTAVDDWENETHDDILVSEYRDWAFLGFSWEDPRMTEDWNAEHFAHVTPFAKGDDDEVVMAPYAVWRKKGE